MEELLEIAKKAFPPVDGSLELVGINDKIEILWDNWGIPHIFAKSIEDAYFAQGYVHAHHRLWQMEIFRRLTTGELSELIGEATLDSDKHYKIIGLQFRRKIVRKKRFQSIIFIRKLCERCKCWYRRSKNQSPY